MHSRTNLINIIHLGQQSRAHRRSRQYDCCRAATACAGTDGNTPPTAFLSPYSADGDTRGLLSQQSVPARQCRKRAWGMLPACTPQQRGGAHCRASACFNKEQEGAAYRYALHSVGARSSVSAFLQRHRLVAGEVGSTCEGVQGCWEGGDLLLHTVKAWPLQANVTPRHFLSPTTTAALVCHMKANAPCEPTGAAAGECSSSTLQCK